jgi:hypothetical protein
VELDISRIGGTQMTKRDKREAMKAEMEQKLREGIELLGAQMERRHQIREQWKSDSGDLTNAHLFATSATAILVNNPLTAGCHSLLPSFRASMSLKCASRKDCISRLPLS